MHNGHDEHNTNQLENGNTQNTPPVTLERYNTALNVIGNTAETAGHVVNLYNQIYSKPTVTTSKTTTTRRQNEDGSTTEESSTTNTISLLNNVMKTVANVNEPSTPVIVCGGGRGGAITRAADFVSPTIGLNAGTLATVAGLTWGAYQLASSAYQWFKGSPENKDENQRQHNQPN